MRRIRIRVRLKRPNAPTGTGREQPPEPAAENLPAREFPPVPDGRAVPRRLAPPAELPPREGPAGAASPPRRPLVRVSQAITLIFLGVFRDFDSTLDTILNRTGLQISAAGMTFTPATIDRHGNAAILVVLQCFNFSETHIHTQSGMHAHAGFNFVHTALHCQADRLFDM